ncbi:MAG: FAD-dependent oxidoreductase [Nitrospirae bacterium]|nr:FAD-dependent oxidoreductase [Nitrospirota bacterium]
MTELIDKKTKDALVPLFKSMGGDVRLVFFTQQEPPCPACREQRLILEEVAALSERLTLEIHDFVADGRMAARYGIDKIPALAVIGARDFGIRFFGMTAGYEFTSLIEGILLAASGKSGLPPEFEQLVNRINEPVHIQVMTTVTCPYCPDAVHAAFQLAMANDNIRADMVEVGSLPLVSNKYAVSGVPKTVINEVFHVEGAMPVDRLFMEVLKAVKPEDYARLEDARREARPGRRARKAEEGRDYELIIVGGGPAAMSAAVYAARKDLDVLLVSRDVGGQMNYTAEIDNYLGLPGLSGHELTELFRNHAESYPVAMKLGENVAVIKKDGDRFSVTMADGSSFAGNAVIYTAGKEYRRLGIPREEMFIGKGIAFCATCDAPLYRGKKVAVVGGGNSAFTAARDLMNFATEVHVIHRRGEFTADESLQRKVSGAINVFLHPGMLVREILGGSRFEGIRMISTDGEKREELRVDGMFLEIGLEPNTAPVSGLIALNERREIPVNARNETALDGFFAAGDCTDVFEKQICIAVGDGAKAALSAHRYLNERGLTRSRAKSEEVWG